VVSIDTVRERVALQRYLGQQAPPAIQHSNRRRYGTWLIVAHAVVLDASDSRFRRGRSCTPRLSPAARASSATLLSGLFLPQRDPESCVRGRARIRKPNLAEGSALAQRKGFPNSLPRSRLCRPSLRSSSALLRMGDTPPLALCRPAFARRRSACSYMPRMA